METVEYRKDAPFKTSKVSSQIERLSGCVDEAILDNHYGQEKNAMTKLIIPNVFNGNA